MFVAIDGSGGLLLTLSQLLEFPSLCFQYFLFDLIIICDKIFVLRLNFRIVIFVIIEVFDGVSCVFLSSFLYEY